MSAQAPLTGTSLISCAKANAPLGLAAAAESCGFGNDYEQFKISLQDACSDIGVEIQVLKDLVSEPQKMRRDGLEISPDSPSQL